MSRLGPLREDITRWGLGRTLWSLAIQRLRPWVIVCRVHSRVLGSGENSRPLPDGIELRWLDEDDLLEAAREMPDQLSAEFVRSALQRGDVCVGAYANGRLIGFTWLSFTTAPFKDGLWVRFARPFRYGYHAYTHRDYRGQGISNQIIQFADEECLARGYTRTLAFIETHNYASRFAAQRRGSALVGYAGYLKVFGRHFTFTSPGARRHGFSLHLEAVPSREG